MIPYACLWQAETLEMGTSNRHVCQQSFKKRKQFRAYVVMRLNSNIWHWIVYVFRGIECYEEGFTGTKYKLGDTPVTQALQRPLSNMAGGLHGRYAELDGSVNAVGFPMAIDANVGHWSLFHHCFHPFYRQIGKTAAPSNVSLLLWCTRTDRCVVRGRLGGTFCDANFC